MDLVIPVCMLTVIEFESAWHYLLDEYDLHRNEFLSQIYMVLHINGRTSKKNSVANRQVLKGARPGMPYT
jgi:hypothetical protein